MLFTNDIRIIVKRTALITVCVLMCLFYENVYANNNDRNVTDELTAIGIIHGDEDGLRLDMPITRAELSVLFANTTIYHDRLDMYEYQYLKYLFGGYEDVCEGMWYDPYLWCMKSADAWDYIFGDDNYIQPDAYVNEEEFIKAMAFVIGNVHFAYDYIKTIYVTCNEVGYVSREKAFEYIYWLLDEPIFMFETEKEFPEKNWTYLNQIRSDGNAEKYITVLNTLGLFNVYGTISEIDNDKLLLKILSSNNFDSRAYGNGYNNPEEFEMSVPEDFEFGKDDRIYATIKKTEDQGYKIIYARAVE